jgi:hypothetical protein
MHSDSSVFSTPRSRAIGDLFAALEGLMISYNALPAAERAERWTTDADRITGEIARQLASTRRRLTADPDLRPATAS